MSLTVVEGDLGRFPVSGQSLQKLRVAVQERVQHQIVALSGELAPGQLHPSLQSSQVLQDAVQRHCTETNRNLFLLTCYLLTLLCGLH